MIGKTLVIMTAMLLLNACSSAPEIPGKSSTKIFNTTKKEVLSTIIDGSLQIGSTINSSTESSVIVDKKLTGSTARIKYDVVNMDGYVILYAQVFKIENYGTKKEKITKMPESRDLDMILYKIKRRIRQ